MKTLEIKDGVVRNIIRIAQSQRDAYAQAQEVLLIDVEELLPVEPGDMYNGFTGLIYRNGVDLRELVSRPLRDQLLAATDYLMATDYPLADEARSAIIAYRQALRDLPDTPGWPASPQWPIYPDRAPGGDSLWHILDAMIGGGAA